VGESKTTGVPEFVTVTATALEVDAGYVLLPENVAAMELAPACSADPRTKREQVPPLRVQLPRLMPPAAKPTVPASAGAAPLEPVGTPPFTVAVSLVDCADVRAVTEAPSVVVVVNALDQLVSRLVTFNVPIPVTSSYPGAEGKATVNDVEPVRDNVPIVAPALTKHPVEPAWQGTSLLPLVTSLNVHVDAGRLTVITPAFVVVPLE
jgi:hypothetical protein